MSEETNTEMPKTEPAKQESPKQGRPPKAARIKNLSQRPITLAVDRNNKETILPTETKEVSKEFMSEVKKNRAAMTFFENDELVEV